MLVLVELARPSTAMKISARTIDGKELRISEAPLAYVVSPAAEVAEESKQDADGCGDKAGSQARGKGDLGAVDRREKVSRPRLSVPKRKVLSGLWRTSPANTFAAHTARSLARQTASNRKTTISTPPDEARKASASR